VSRSWAGPLVTGLIVLGVAAILILNFQPSPTPKPVEKPDTSAIAPSGEDLKENPIGEPVIKNHIQVNAVWLAAVTMDGMGTAPSGPSDIIHVEADVRSIADNPNGFAKDEFVPYLKVAYSIVPASGGPAIDKGDLYPMVASDGLHYGANIVAPKPGTYRLIYDIEPPSAGGLGRHVGKGGVAAWWKPFRAEFDWTVQAPPPHALVGSR
jgi:periplasmic iron binding protein